MTQGAFQAKNTTETRGMVSHHSMSEGHFHPSRTIVHAKLEMTEPGDYDEQEADAVAETIAAGGKISRKISGGSGTSGINVSNQMESQLNHLRGGGHVMPTGLRNMMESGFGQDFSHVRLHTDSEAASLSNSIHAKAFTHGNDIYFNQGQFSPNTTEGQKLMAHELTHVVQGSGKVGREAKLKDSLLVSNCSDLDNPECCNKRINSLEILITRIVKKYNDIFEKIYIDDVPTKEDWAQDAFSALSAGFATGAALTAETGVGIAVGAAVGAIGAAAVAIGCDLYYYITGKGKGENEIRSYFNNHFDSILDKTLLYTESCKDADYLKDDKLNSLYSLYQYLSDPNNQENVRKSIMNDINISKTYLKEKDYQEETFFYDGKYILEYDGVLFYLEEDDEDYTSEELLISTPTLKEKIIEKAKKEGCYMKSNSKYLLQVKYPQNYDQLLSQQKITRNLKYELVSKKDALQDKKFIDELRMYIEYGIVNVIACEYENIIDKRGQRDVCKNSVNKRQNLYWYQKNLMRDQDYDPDNRSFTLDFLLNKYEISKRQRERIRRFYDDKTT